MRVSRKLQERFAAPCSMLNGAGRIRYRHVGITAETCVWTAEAAELQAKDGRAVSYLAAWRIVAVANHTRV